MSWGDRMAPMIGPGLEWTRQVCHSRADRAAVTRKVFRKLGVRSRTQLHRTLAPAPAHAETRAALTSRTLPKSLPARQRRAWPGAHGVRCALSGPLGSL